MSLYSNFADVAFVHYLTDVKLSDGLLNGEIPSALLVCCSDMGSRLPYVCSSAKANLLIFQNFGHRTEGIAEHVLYNQVSNVIVYGHTDCKFLQSLDIRDESNQMEKDLITESFTGEVEATTDLNAGKTVIWKERIELRVLAELEAFLQHDEFLKSAEKLKVILHAWVYDAERGELDVFDPREHRFVPVKQRSALHT